MSRHGVSDGRGAKAVCYGTSLAALAGMRITGRVKWQDAGRIHENDVTSLPPGACLLLLYVQETQQGAGAVTEPAVASAADGPGHVEKTPPFGTTGPGRRIRNGGADWGSERGFSVRVEDETGYVPGGPIAPVCAPDRTALLVSLLGPSCWAAGGLFAGVSMAVLAFYMLMVGLSLVGGPGRVSCRHLCWRPAVQAGQRWADQLRVRHR